MSGLGQVRGLEKIISSYVDKSVFFASSDMTAYVLYCNFNFTRVPSILVSSHMQNRYPNISSHETTFLQTKQLLNIFILDE